MREWFPMRLPKQFKLPIYLMRVTLTKELKRQIDFSEFFFYLMRFGGFLADYRNNEQRPSLARVIGI